MAYLYLKMEMCCILMLVGISASGGNVQRKTANTTSERRKDVIDQIGERLCPYTDYCYRQKEPLVFEHLVPCCGACYCGDNCWKAGNCCPDKEVIDAREPIGNCHVSIVKRAENNTKIYNGISHDIKAYRIIDDCPDSEQNLTVINKCTLSDIDHVSDYCWVSDDLNEHIYQNKFCAACHGVEQFTDWQLESRCEELLFSDFSQMNSLILSDKCDIIMIKPDNIDLRYHTCTISDYTRCNQTGLWGQYDPDIDWACNIHDSVFMAEENNFTILYKNAFCYACNSQGIQQATAACDVTHTRTPGFVSNIAFSAVIDYKRNDYLGSVQADYNPACKVNEIMDPYLKTCRLLICPYLNIPFYGECKQLIQKTYGLSVETIYTLSVVWSEENYSAADKEDKLWRIGKNIFKHLIFSNLACPFCYRDVRLVKEMVQSIGSDTDNAVFNTTCGKFIEPHLLLYYISSTSSSCSLPKLLQEAVTLADSVIPVYMYVDGTTFRLKIELLKENAQRLINEARVLVTEGTKSACFVPYRLTTEKICPNIRVNLWEFTTFLMKNNTDILKSMFTDPERYMNKYEEICVDDYFEKISHIDIRQIRNNGRPELGMESLFFGMTMIVYAL